MRVTGGIGSFKISKKLGVDKSVLKVLIIILGLGFQVLDKAMLKNKR